MPVDPTGTKPGLQPEVKEPVKLNMRCKNSKGCDSMQVTEIVIPNSAGRHLYRCVKCNTTWGVQTGGSVDFG